MGDTHITSDMCAGIHISLRPGPKCPKSIPYYTALIYDRIATICVNIRESYKFANVDLEENSSFTKYPMQRQSEKHILFRTGSVCFGVLRNTCKAFKFYFGLWETNLVSEVTGRGLGRAGRDGGISKGVTCPYDQFFDIHFFYIFVHNRSSLNILPNFNLLRSIERAYFGPYLRESTAAINFPCSNSWLKIGENDVILILKNTSRIEIIIRISVENCTNTGAKGFVLLRVNCCTNCYYNFNPCGIFENMTSFPPIFNQ